MTSRYSFVGSMCVDYEERRRGEKKKGSRKDRSGLNAQERNMALQFSHGCRKRERLYHTLSRSHKTVLDSRFPFHYLSPASTLFSWRDSCYLQREMQVKRIGGMEGKDGGGWKAIGLP